MKSSETSRERGYDAGRVNRRRRHILMDTMGPLLMVLVFSASVQDQDGARRLPIMKRSEMIPPATDFLQPRRVRRGTGTVRVAVAVPCRRGAYLFGQSANYFRLNFRSHS